MYLLEMWFVWDVLIVIGVGGMFRDGSFSDGDFGLVWNVNLNAGPALHYFVDYFEAVA